MKKKAIFIAATGQNVGKTTICLGLLAGLKKRFGRLGFLKPVGQEKMQVAQGFDVDKDAVLFKEYFQMAASYHDMSPVLCASGFTRNFLDEKVSEEDLLHKIQLAWTSLEQQHDFMLVEGTGHVGVGSLLNLNNARIAAQLGLDVVMIASGGLGSAFDELSLNIQMCKSHGVNVRGIILNKVYDDKRDMIMEYFPKALKRLGIPLVGCIPYVPLLQRPSMKDFESLFERTLVYGKTHRLRHFQEIRLVAGSLESFVQELKPNQLIITPACREDIIIATVGAHMRADLKCGLILTGQNPPREELLAQITTVDIPILYAPLCSFDVMKMITSFTAKIRQEDTQKVQQAISIVEQHVDFEKLCKVNL